MDQGLALASAKLDQRLCDGLLPDETLLEIHRAPVIPTELLCHLCEVQLVDLGRAHMQVDGKQENEPLAGAFGHHKRALPHALSADIRPGDFPLVLRVGRFETPIERACEIDEEAGEG